jgi:hypothetical protein
MTLPSSPHCIGDVIPEAAARGGELLEHLPDMPVGVQ